MTPKPQTTDPDTLTTQFFAKVTAVKQQPAYVQPASERPSRWFVAFCALSMALLGAGAWNLALCIFGG